MTTTTTPALTPAEAGELIAEPPTTFTEHDLDHELRPDPPSRWGRRITGVLLVLTILAVGALGGALAQKHWGSATGSGTAATGGLSGRLSGGFGGAGGFVPGGAPPDGGPPAGTTGGTTGGAPAGG